MSTNAPSKVATSWAVAKPVSVQWMHQLREIPIELPLGWVNQFLYMSMLYYMIKPLDGDVVECGLGEGNTFAMLAFFIGSEGKERTLHGFDSFEGWPEPDPSDTSPRRPMKGEWLVREEMVTARFEESGIYKEFPNLEIRITKGFVGQTLPRFPLARRVAFLHIDLDLYEGYRDALANLYDLVVKGGVIAFDEYREFHPELPEYIVDGHPVAKWPGCDKAVDEFFVGKGEVLRYHPSTQKYYIVKGSK